MSSEPVDLEALLCAARAGRRDASDALLTALLPQLREQVHRRLEHSYRRHNGWIVSLFSTGDVVQDLALGLLRDLSAFRGSTVASLTAWLATQVEHRIVERLRYFGRDKRDQRRTLASESTVMSIADTAASPDADAERLETFALVRSVLDELPADERALLELGLDADLSWDEVAARLGLATAEAARQRHKRARARVSLILSRKHPDLFGGEGTASADAR
ncbi:MAG: sigma-70 family RNA polymerase sigma factor [Planctomycetes bacterium]|nr:sigma-70 family RNA polymerase sigma factor [Planctomycetota bacterium]